MDSIRPDSRGLTAYKAASWSTANGETSDRQPYAFYRAGDVDSLIDDIEEDRAFEQRKRDALERFYQEEIRSMRSELRLLRSRLGED